MTAAGARGEHTVVCSVAFVDIVDYAKKPVDEQLRLKAGLDALLAQALADVPAGERIILDTGEGAAVSFLGGPEDCLFFAIAVRDALLARGDEVPRLRIGINLGPVRLVKDAGGQPNIIGDGMSVGHRIMSFAGAGQILVSRPYHEALAALSADYARLFDFVGMRTDKHVREHAVFALGGAPAPARLPRRASPAAATATAGHGAAGTPLAAAWAGVVRRPALATALAVVLILIASVVLRQALREAAVEPATAPVAEVPPPPVPEAPAPASSPPAERAASEPAPEPAPPPVAAAPQSSPKAQPGAPAVATGLVRLVVVPWGEVYVDGQKHGVAPPLREISLKAGKHRIEIRNPGFESYLKVVDVGADQEIRIRHRFE